MPVVSKGDRVGVCSQLTSPLGGSIQSRANHSRVGGTVAAPEATILRDQLVHPAGLVGSRLLVLLVGVNHSLRAPQALVLPLRARLWETSLTTTSRRVQMSVGCLRSHGLHFASLGQSAKRTRSRTSLIGRGALTA